MRNLIEYKEGTSSDDYMLLTSLLHIKDNTRDLRLSHLETVIASSINNTSFSSDIDKDKLVLDFIYETANNLCTNPVIDEIRLENKVTLSVGIRLKAEEFLWSKISNKSAIRGVQTGILYDRYISEFGTSTENKEIKSILGQVILMTPENIHINSFMYEPLMDLSVHHLVDLYQAVSNLVP
ncbi:hypothetical protein [Vibrio cholerae]|uniref:hypothetical protein n=1 Tax=Vibrio cholerae TaxID=666 RepID=UPI0021AF0656|nr:hypothetical protein [Vibrio cholerae]